VLEFVFFISGENVAMRVYELHHRGLQNDERKQKSHLAADTKIEMMIKAKQSHH
jgi:hypothetical protein